MGIRPAKCYKALERPYTRQSQRKPRKGYVKGVPHSKITKFESGDKKKKYELVFYLIANQSVQIRGNALEAARQAASKILTDDAGLENCFLKIMVFPHHVLRENALATGAGADRFQTGMRQSFGNPIGTAARVKAGQKLIEIKIDRLKMMAAKKALKVASSKLPLKTTIVSQAS